MKVTGGGGDETLTVAFNHDDFKGVIRPKAMNVTRLRTKSMWRRGYTRRHLRWRQSHNACNVNHTMWCPSPSSPQCSKLKIQLLWQHHVTLCCDSQSVLRISQCQWHTDGANVAGIYRTDTESDTAVKTAAAVCEYCGASTTRLITPQNYFMNKCCQVFQHLWDFQNWHSAKLIIKSAVVDDRKWQALLPPGAAG